MGKKNKNKNKNKNRGRTKKADVVVPPTAPTEPNPDHAPEPIPEPIPDSMSEATPEAMPASATVAPATGAGRRLRSKSILLFGLGLLAVVAIWPPWNRSGDDDPVAPPTDRHASRGVSSGPEFADFVGSQACASCHAREYDVWKNSTHAQAGGEPGEVKIIARFDGKPLRFKDAVVTPFVNPKGEHVFRIEVQGRAPQELKADYVVGGGHMYGGGTQSFFGKFADGSVRFLPFDFIRDESIWFVQLKKGGVWVPITEEISMQEDLANWPPHRVLGMHRGVSTCQNCHGSQISILHDETTQRFDTRFTTLGINCESCHGAGRRHIEIVSKPGFEAFEDIGMEPLATLSKDASLMICFQCHAGKSMLRPEEFFPGPGAPLEHYMSVKIPLLDGSRFLSDGRIRLFGYQSNHLYSDCYLSGSMTCVDCHDPHSQSYRDVFWKPLEGRFDNGQCTACHASKAANPERHSHHKAGSAGNLCTSCHMPFLQHPGLGSKLRFARSDHTIPIPRPAFDAKIGIENACLQCHKDMGTAALQTKVTEWYGVIKPHAEVIADLIEAEGVTDPALGAKLLLNPTANHPMAQMDGLFRFLRRFFRPDQKPSDGQVLAKLKAFATSDDLDLKAVALMAIEAGYGKDPAVRRFLDEQLDNLGELEEPIKSRWASSADQLGGIFVDKKDIVSAVRFMESAAVAISNDVAIKSHLAVTYMLLGDPGRALPHMLDAVQLEPKDSGLRVQLATCYVKLRRIPEAVVELEEALKLNPGDAEARKLLQRIRAARRGK